MGWGEVTCTSAESGAFHGCCEAFHLVPDNPWMPRSRQCLSDDSRATCAREPRILNPLSGQELDSQPGMAHYVPLS